MKLYSRTRRGGGGGGTRERSQLNQVVTMHTFKPYMYKMTKQIKVCSICSLISQTRNMRKYAMELINQWYSTRQKSLASISAAIFRVFVFTVNAIVRMMIGCLYGGAHNFTSQLLITLFFLWSISTGRCRIYTVDCRLHEQPSNLYVCWIHMPWKWIQWSEHLANKSEYEWNKRRRKNRRTRISITMWFFFTTVCSSVLVRTNHSALNIEIMTNGRAHDSTQCIHLLKYKQSYTNEHGYHYTWIS